MSFAKSNSWLLALELAALIIIGTFFLPGGDDLYNFYLPFAGGYTQQGHRFNFLQH